MRLDQIRLRNFRLLRRTCLDLTRSAATTVLVGPNNSGKTSVMEALRLFLGSPSEARKKLCLHDLSRMARARLGSIQRRLESATDEEERIAILRRFAPRIRLELVFSYTEEPGDIAVASELLMDLNPTESRVGLRIEYAVANAKGLAADFEARRRPEDGLDAFLKGRLSDYYDVSYSKISVNGREAEPLEGGEVVRRLIKADFVPAQRYIDDDEGSRAAKLSRLLHDHYNRYYKAKDFDGYSSIEDAITASASDLTERYEAAFVRLVARLRGFGYPQGHSTPGLRIRAEMSAETVYRDNTRVYYTSGPLQGATEETLFELPEKYNGLGFKNLIFIVLQLESFRAAIDTMEGERPRVHVVGIEEPEVHLHPQMQCIFIREIARALADGEGPTPQVILSTHSSHIVADSGFDPIRYFRRKGAEALVKDLSQLCPSGEDVLPFLRRYVKLTHCDLFFADKAVLVEGQVERLLLPLMLEKSVERETCRSLPSAYISISEIGGAHAHKFRPLIEFLGLPTLIITDLDSVGSDGKKCPVGSGALTSNVALRSWLPGKSQIDELLDAIDSEKTDGVIHVAYQTREGEHCGRSFEEAFIYANLDWLSEHHGELLSTGRLIGEAAEGGLAAHAYDISAKLQKVDFALDLITPEGWHVPRYILDGLEWLAGQEAA